jgi:hypothetical protein
MEPRNAHEFFSSKIEKNKKIEKNNNNPPNIFLRTNYVLHDTASNASQLKIPLSARF